MATITRITHAREQRIRGTHHSGTVRSPARTSLRVPQMEYEPRMHWCQHPAGTSKESQDMSRHRPFPEPGTQSFRKDVAVHESGLAEPVSQLEITGGVRVKFLGTARPQCHHAALRNRSGQPMNERPENVRLDGPPQIWSGEIAVPFLLQHAVYVDQQRKGVSDMFVHLVAYHDVVLSSRQRRFGTITVANVKTQVPGLRLECPPTLP